MMHHVDANDDNCPDGLLDVENNRLLPRGASFVHFEVQFLGISVVSINRPNQYDSRTSLVSRNKLGIMDSIKRQFSRDGRKISISRPNRLCSSEISLNQDTPVAEVRFK